MKLQKPKDVYKENKQYRSELIDELTKIGFKFQKPKIKRTVVKGYYISSNGKGRYTVSIIHPKMTTKLYIGSFVTKTEAEKAGKAAREAAVKKYGSPAEKEILRMKQSTITEK